MRGPSESSLRNALKDWTDIDIAAFHLGVSLDIIPVPPGDSLAYNFSGKKWVFWTDNPMGNMLFNLLEDMTSNGILEKHIDDNHLYRWNPKYDWHTLE